VVGKEEEHGKAKKSHLTKRRKKKPNKPNPASVANTKVKKSVLPGEKNS